MMADFERVLDDLRLHLAETPEEKARAEGFIAKVKGDDFGR